MTSIYIQQRGKDAFRAYVRSKGHPTITGTHPTRKQAQKWAHEREMEIEDGKAGVIPDKRVSDLLERYAQEISPGKEGYRWEVASIKRFQQEPLAQVRLRELDTPHISAWRGRRLQSVGNGTVLREWNLWSNIFYVALNEWKWLKTFPMKGVKRPDEPEHRTFLYTQAQIDRIYVACGNNYNTSSGRVGFAFQFALETAMRAGEICRLTWDNVNLTTRVAHLPKTKNGSARNVPLSSRAIDILNEIPRSGDTVFSIAASTLSNRFVEIADRAMVGDGTFHDSRHYAITHLSKKMDVLDLARMVGHKDIRELMTYYNRSAEDVAKQLV